MATFMKEFEHLEIPLEAIKSATNNFDKSKVVGGGGFGKVYKAELSLSQSEGKSTVALKRLDRRYGQGDPEFFKEIRMLCRYRHENLISLLGFCCQQGEMILVYEYASRGSLDSHLNSPDLTWTQRIKICLDAAKGLKFLHDPNATHQRVLHCDIKSANILLNENFTGKVSDFGLSKMGSADHQYSVLITGAVGTPGYCDPLYMETFSLTKESDVYSFGVVLFEVLSGRLCVENRNGQLTSYIAFWKKAYEENKLEEIIFKDFKQQMNPSALETFASIAYQCLKTLRVERPSMSLIVEKLKNAYEVQERHDISSKVPLPKEYEEIVLSATSPLMYTSLEELKELVSKGVLVNKDKTWLSITEKGEHIERIYIEACLDPAVIKTNSLKDPPGDIVNSRFPGGRCFDYEYNFKARVRGQYLTPEISYTVNLVFIYEWHNSVNRYTPLKYKVDGEEEKKVYIIYHSTLVREDGWFVAPLYQFTSQHKTVDLEFEFEYHNHATNLLVAGIEFQPSKETVELQVFEEYQDIVEVASQSLFYTSLDELKKILSIGVHLNGYKTWFSINNKGEHSHMISMKDCLITNEDFPSQYLFDGWSRFPAGLYQTNSKGFKTRVRTQLLSPSVTYTVNLVCKNYSSVAEQAYVDLKYRLRGAETTCTVYLANKSMVEDDWMYMAELYQFTSIGSMVDLEIYFEDHGANIGVDGILFQPLEMVENPMLEDDTLSSDDTEKWTMKENLFSSLGKWFQSNNDSAQDDTPERSYLDKNEKKCLMLSAKASRIRTEGQSTWRSLPKSRFGEVLVITAGNEFQIVSEIQSTVLSLVTTYASYLIYKLPRDRSIFEAPLKVNTENGFSRDHWYIYLVSPPHTPIIGPKFDENSYKSLNKRKLNSVPRKRSDGLMEVKVWQFDSWQIRETVSMHLLFEHPAKKDLGGLIIHGIEIRPI